jgi:pyruvate dehydrogenase (quinone)
LDSPDRVADAWEEAFAADRPVVYEAITGPEVPSLPPHIRFEQAKELAGL